MREIKELIEQVRLLNSHFEKMFPKMPTLSRKQVMAELGVSTATIANYEAKYGKSFKICRNEYSANFVKELKARRKCVI